MAILKIGDKEYASLESPLQALVLMREVMQQYFGPLWTNFTPKCPLCNEGLQDFTKNMHRPVGSCANSSCGAEIHAYDYFGKMMDILRLVEEEYGPVEEIAKKKISVEEPKKKKKGNKGNGSGHQQQGSRTVKLPSNTPSAKETELIFEY